MALPPSLSRRDALRLGGVAGFASLAGCTTRGDPPEVWTPEPGSWPRDGYDTQNTRHNPHASPPTDPTVLWEVSDPTARFVTLVVADDTVFVGGTSIRAYETDGTLRWKLNRSAEAMAVHDGALYVADGTDGVASLSPADGSVAWETEVPRVANGVLPTADRVFVALHDRLLCLDIETGEEQWAEWGEGGTGPTGFALGESLYTADVGSVARRTPRDVLRRYRDQPPGVDWEATQELNFPSAPTLGDGVVFVPDESVGTSRGGLAAFTIDDGSFRWNVDLGDAAYSPALVDDLAIVGGASTGEETSAVVALDRTDGTVRWRAEPDHWATSVVVAGDVVLAAGNAMDGSITGGITAYELDGRHRWYVDAAGLVSMVAPVGDRVYAATTRGHVYALR